MKKIFIGSSSEAIQQAETIAAVIEDIDNVEVLLWTNSFKNGDITFVAIEQLSENISGAIILASPDDESMIKNRKVNIPRSNVIFEYGYLAAKLNRKSVALCKYNNTELPSDFNGLTHIDMGKFSHNNTSISFKSTTLIKEWVNNIPEYNMTNLKLHNYSGVWNTKNIFKKWRGIQLRENEYAIFQGDAILSIPIDGENGVGNLCGALEINIDNCYVRFQISDTLYGIKIHNDSSMSFKSEMHSRQRLEIHGEQPQIDGFEQNLRGVRTYSTNLKYIKQNKLEGVYKTLIGDAEYTTGFEYWEKQS